MNKERRRSINNIKANIARLKKEITDLQLKPEIVDPEDIEMLQDLIMVAVNEGIRQIEEMSNAEMSKLTGGLGIPGL